jgi:hypothetical protein
MKDEDMYSKTIDYLEKFDNQHDFERMDAAILIALGYKKVVPIAPRGGSDDGKDIEYEDENGARGLACVTLQGNKDIETKFRRDFSRRQPGEYNEYMFFCKAHLTASQKFQFTQYCLNELQAMLTLYDIEALSLLLDNDIRLREIRETYLYVSDQEKLQINQEQQRRSALLRKLKTEYIASHPNVSERIIFGTEPLPKEWIERRLEEIGEKWRQDVYLV